EGLKGTVETEMGTYDLHRAYRAVESFILDDLSRWYVKLVRERTWIESEDRGKVAAYRVLHEVLETLAILLAPATPHIAEAMYQRLDGRKLSVHMLDWPASRSERIQPKLERSMAVVQELVEIVSKERQRGAARGGGPQGAGERPVHGRRGRSRRDDRPIDGPFRVDDAGGCRPSRDAPRGDAPRPTSDARAAGRGPRAGDHPSGATDAKGG